MTEKHQQPQPYEFPDPYTVCPRRVIDQPDRLEDWSWAVPPRPTDELKRLLARIAGKTPVSDQHPSDTNIL